jgi:hypothetical protein
MTLDTSCRASSRFDGAAIGAPDPTAACRKERNNYVIYHVIRCVDEDAETNADREALVAKARGGIVTDVNEFNRRNIEEFRSHRGRLGGPFEGAPVLLLHTRGARSGQERVHPLVYLEDKGGYLLFASAGGVDRSPAWYWHLIANPDASIEVGDEHLKVRAID